MAAIRYGKIKTPTISIDTTFIIGPPPVVAVFKQTVLKKASIDEAYLLRFSLCILCIFLNTYGGRFYLVSSSLPSSMSAAPYTTVNVINCRKVVEYLSLCTGQLRKYCSPGKSYACYFFKDAYQIKLICRCIHLFFTQSPYL